MERAGLFIPLKHALRAFVELVGLKPTASCLQGRRSSQLNYNPVFIGGVYGIWTHDFLRDRQAKTTELL